MNNGNGTHVNVDEEPLAFQKWPVVPAPAAYHGVLGDVVRAIEPHSEADPVAILAQLLACFGNLLNRGPHFIAEADRHALNLNVLIVGKTASGRKGASFGRAKAVMADVDPDWSRTRIIGGLSSGEGLIAAVQDPVERLEKQKDGTERIVTIEPGVSDKRLMVVETEFARVLKVMARDGNTLSQIVRQAWDSGDLCTLTKQSTRATEAHISIVGHIPKFELSRLLSALDVSNGFLNRFLIICAKRSKSLPEGGNLDPSALSALIARLSRAMDFGRKVGRIDRDEAARDLWYAEYERLNDVSPGLLGAVTSRAPAQVMRLACLYAILDLSPVIRRVHLEGALAFHGYVERSVTYLFGESLGDPIAERILEALKGKPGGMTRSEIRAHFSNHLTKPETDNALKTLADAELAFQTPELTAGRPREVWRAALKAPKAPEGRLKALNALMAPPGKGEAWEGDE